MKVLITSAKGWRRESRKRRKEWPSSSQWILGAIGLGGIGTEVAKRDVVFRTRVVATKAHPEKESLHLWKSFWDRMGQTVCWKSQTSWLYAHHVRQDCKNDQSRKIEGREENCVSNTEVCMCAERARADLLEGIVSSII